MKKPKKPTVIKSIQVLMGEILAKGKKLPKSLRHYLPKKTKLGRNYGTVCYPRNPKQIAQMNAMHEKIHGSV